MAETGAEVPTARQEVLGQAGEIKVIRPDPAAIALSEGVHLEVVGNKDVSWRNQDTKDILKKQFFALPVAKVLSEGRYSSDFWANIHLNSYPNFDTGVNVFGRNPNSDEGWARPVTIREVPSETLPQDEKTQLSKTLRKYLPLWEQMLSNIELFKEGIGQLSLDDPGFVEGAEPNANKIDKVIWENEKFSLVIVQNPHLSGLHLVVHPRESYWEERGGFKRSWQVDAGSQGQEHIKGFLEASAILIGAEKILLQEEGLPFYNPEIHFSGNWAPDLRPQDQGGKLKTDYLEDPDLRKARKTEKRAHRVDSDEEWQTTMHGHLYATRDPKFYVGLPSRPQKEVPDQWRGIVSLSADETTRINEVISQRLTPWLSENARGGLIR